MPILKPFYIAYREGSGIAQVLGDYIPDLRAHLETYGSGLEPSGDLRGGPLLTTLREGVALCWVRGVQHARGNVWEAWGVVAPRVELVKPWPSHWEAMRSDPSEESIKTFAERLERGWGSSWPPQPHDLPLLLSRIHRSNVSESQVIKFKIPIYQQSDIGALAWLWLLGPISWKAASVAPPHRMAVGSIIEPSYEGLIIDAPQPNEDAGVSSFIEDLLALVRKGDIGSAERKIESFRQEDLGVRRTTLGVISTPTLDRSAVRVPRPPQVQKENKKRLITSIFGSAEQIKSKDESKADEKGDGAVTPPMQFMPQEHRLIAMESKLNALLLAALLFFVVNALGRADAIFGQKKEPSEPAPPSEATQPLPQTTVEVNEVVFDRETLNRVHGSLLGRMSLTASPGLQNLDLSKVGEPELRKRLAQAATQIRLSEEHCEPMTTLIDGDIGDKTKERISKCNNQNVNEIAEDDDAALKWLHAWLGLSSTPR